MDGERETPRVARSNEVDNVSKYPGDGRVDTAATGRRPGATPAGDGVASQARRCRIALLCQQSRLRRLLRLSLLTDGYDVVEWASASRPEDPRVDAVVVDLDSLRQGVEGVLTLLREWCIAETTSLLFISVYPLELRALRHDGPYDGLQPPFPPEEIPDRVGRLLKRVASRSANLDPSAQRRRDGTNCVASDPVRP